VSKSDSRISEDFFSGGTGVRVLVHVRVSSLRFFRPKPSVLLFGEAFKTLQQFPGQTGPTLRIEFESFGLEVFDTQAPILH
jgi:hypothetical protein